MRRFRKIRPSTLLLTTALSLAWLPLTAHAVEYECSLSGDTRFLRLELPGKDHLCEVTVTLASEGERRVKWYADNESLFCSEKIAELRDKYEDLWDYECTDWPDRVGIDKLSARQRTIVDQLLKTHGEDAAKESALPRIESVRATASPASDALPGMLAVQLFLGDGDDVLRIITDNGAAWEVLTDVNRLADVVEPIEGYRIIGAYIDSVDDTATVDIMTLLAPDESLPASVDAESPAVCEGRQSFRIANRGELEPVTPHRHLCR